MSKRRYMRLEANLLPGPDDDLIRWLRELEFENLYHGAKSERIKAIFRRGLQTPETPSVSTTPASLDIDALLTALLPQIRKVIDAALAEVGGSISTGARLPDEERDADTEAEFLAILDSELFLPEDDEETSDAR